MFSASGVGCYEKLTICKPVLQYALTRVPAPCTSPVASLLRIGRNINAPGIGYAAYACMHQFWLQRPFPILSLSMDSRSALMVSINMAYRRD